MPHIASATCSAALGRRAGAHLVHERELEPLDLVLRAARPPASAGTGTPGRWSSQAPFAIAKRLRSAIGSVIGGASVADAAVPIVVAACTRSCVCSASCALPRGAVVSLRARRAGDGRHRRDPVADRPGDRRRSTPATATACATLVLDHRRRRAAAPRPDRRAAARRGARLAGGRARPARPHLRPPADARAGLLRPPADRPADVARDRRPAGGALLPRLRARLHAPVAR